MVDCEPISYGCNGGWPDYAITWAAKNGLKTGGEYPYTAVDGKCQSRSGQHKPSGGKTVSASNM